MARKHTRAAVNNKLYAVAVFRNKGQVIICEDVDLPTVKGYFDPERMGYYTKDGHQVYLEGCSKFEELVLWGIPIIN
jgi:hypothetical protein